MTMNLQKREPIRSKKITDAARGQECTFNGPTCNYDSSTVVFCHSNLSEDGKGMRQKADDIFGFFGCSACHDAYDGRGMFSKMWKDECGRDVFHSAMKKTWRILFDLGVFKIS